MSQGQQADILWTAYIDDQTDQFFRQFNLNMSVVNNGVINFQTNVTNSFNKTSAGASRAASGVLGIAKAFAFLHLASHILGPIIRDLKEFATETVEVAASGNMLGTVLDFVGQNAGYTSEELEQMVETMNQQGITIRGSRQILLEMIQTNLNLADATTLAARAQDVARVAQVNSTEAAQRMIHAIATLNPLVLRRMRIMVDFEQAYRDYAASIDKAWESLTVEEKQMIATQEVFRATESLVGAYGASMEDVGGQVLTLDRLMEDFQFTLGQVFQPAYSLIVTKFSAALIDARHWLEENKEGVEDFGNRLAGALDLALVFGERLIEVLSLIPDTLNTVGAGIVAVGQILAGIVGPVFGGSSLEEQRKTMEHLGDTAKQALAIVAGAMSALIKTVSLGIEIAVRDIEGMWLSLRYIFGDKSVEKELNRKGREMVQIMSTVKEEIVSSFNEAFLAASEATGLIKPEKVKQTVDKIIDSMGDLKKQTLDAVKAIQELNDAIAKDMAKIAIDIGREDFEEAIRLFRQLTDANRNYMRGLEDIRRRHNRQRADLEKDAAEEERDLAEDQSDKRLELAEDHAEKRLEIEREYIRELEDIQRHYVEDVGEAARQNDAVAVARLMRQRLRQRKDAAIERDRDLEDEDRDYQGRLDDLKEFQEKRRKEIKKDAAQRLLDLQESLDEQLEDAEIARRRELDDMELHNKRRQEDITLQRKWELEDLKAKYIDQIQVLGDELGALELLHDSHIAYLVGKYATYYADDIIARTNWFRDREKIDQQQVGSPYGPGTYGGYGYYEPPTAPTVPTPAPKPPSVPQAPIGGSPYDPPANIVQHCRDHPNDPVCKWYGLSEGGMFMTTEPTRFMSSEQGQPELIAAIPLNRSMDHNINLRGNLNVSGVSPGMERDISGELMSMLQQFGEALASRAGA